MKNFFDRRFILLIAVLLIAGPGAAYMRGGVAGVSDWLLQTIVMLPAIVVAISFHEYAHAMVASWCGDPTPKVAGRCTVDPKAHIDPLGIMSLMLIRFGWGRPVVVNPANFRNKRLNSIMVGLAGVTMNLILAFVFGGIVKAIMTVNPDMLQSGYGVTVVNVFYYGVVINISLMLFNLLPVPPLDGFNVVSDLFNIRDSGFFNFVYSNSTMILLVLILLDVPQVILNKPLGVMVDFIVDTVYRTF